MNNMDNSKEGIYVGKGNVSIKKTKFSEIVITTEIYCDFFGVYIYLKGEKRYVDSVRYRVKGKMVHYSLV